MGDYESLRKMLPLANERTGTVTIKGICDNNIRRIPILQTPTYDELCLMLHRLFRTNLSTNIDNLVLFYRDEDGDQVLITDDMDITHALTHSSVLRITVHDKEMLPPPGCRTDVTSALKDLSLSTKSLTALRSGLNDIKLAVDKILSALPDENEGPLSSQPKSADSGPKTKPLTTADMAELLDSGQGKVASTPAMSSADVPLPVVLPATPSQPPQTQPINTPQQSPASQPPQMQPMNTQQVPQQHHHPSHYANDRAYGAQQYGRPNIHGQSPQQQQQQQSSPLQRQPSLPGPAGSGAPPTDGPYSAYPPSGPGPGPIGAQSQPPQPQYGQSRPYSQPYPSQQPPAPYAPPPPQQQQHHPSHYANDRPYSGQQYGRPNIHGQGPPQPPQY